jgi:hypothetical protein
MGPSMIVELEILRKAAPSGTRRVVVRQVDLLIFHRTPEALDEDVIDGAALTVHADLNVAREEAVEVAQAGEVAPLVAVPDERVGPLQRPIDRGEDEVEL